MGRSLTTWRFVWISTSLGLRMSVLVIPFSILYGWKLEVEQKQFGRSFRILDSDGSLHVERNGDAGLWERQYSFTLLPRRLGDFAAMCKYHQTSPDSHFTRKRLCTIATPEGRITLSDMKLVVTRDGTREEQELGSQGEMQEVLRQKFGVVL